MKKISILLLYLILVQQVCFSQRVIQILDSGSDLIIKEGAYSRSFPKKEISTTLTGTTKLDLLYGLQPILKLTSNAEVTDPTSTSLADLQNKIITMIGLSPTITELDPLVPAHVKAITTTNISNWNSALTSSGTATLTNKTMSGGSNTFSNIPSTAINNTTFPTLTGANVLSGANTYSTYPLFTDTYTNGQARFGSTGQAGRALFLDGTSGAALFRVGYSSATAVTPLIESISVNGLNLSANHASGNIILSTGGTESARILANGNVLIGTTTDAANGKLQVGGPASVNGALVVGGTTTPALNSTYDLGSTTLRYANVFAGQMINIGGQSVYGTSGVGSPILFRQGNSTQIVGGFNTDGTFFNQPLGTTPASTGEQFQNYGTAKITGATNISSTLTATQYRLSALNTAPASATATGTLGEIRVTATYIYVCTATNTWVRAALATW